MLGCGTRIRVDSPSMFMSRICTVPSVLSRSCRHLRGMFAVVRSVVIDESNFWVLEERGSMSTKSPRLDPRGCVEVFVVLECGGGNDSDSTGTGW